MKISIIFLDYRRHDFTEQVKRHNFTNAGYPHSVVTVDRLGIAAALNEGIARSSGHDAIVTMANDILMPEGWLAAMVRAVQVIPETGMCGIHCVEQLGEVEEVKGIKLHKSYTAFGNVMIPMAVLKHVGGFNEDYDPYGMQDADLALRLNNAGYMNYYLHGLKSEHLGHDVGQPSDYRRMKDEGLSASGDKWAYWNKYYEENGYTINFPEWVI